MRNRILHLERAIKQMMPEIEQPVTFLFPDGSEQVFESGHAALMYVIGNRHSDLSQVKILPPEADADSFLYAIMQCPGDVYDDWADYGDEPM